MAKAKKDGRGNNGGKRDGAGRPKELPENERKKSYTVSLKPKDRDAIVKKYKSLTKAIETTLPSKTTPKRK